jgi:tetratricopeptide (TPR) repeat protein
MLEEKGDAAQAALILEKLVKTDENNLEALKAVARIRSALGEKQKARDALRASFYISPFDYKLHTQAGDLSVDLKDNAEALTEFQVALALQPPNIAEANYNVAVAFHALGRQLDAKRSVLRALEAAPRYEKAQELLLRITGQ